jgi:hypothetical protein
MALRLEPTQTRRRPTTSYEHALADEIEAIFGKGVWDLAGVVAALNDTSLRLPDGAAWTEERFTAEIARLGAEEGAAA